MGGGGSRCPGCGEGLFPHTAGGLRRYDCRCGSLVTGIGALRQILAPGVAQHLWTAEAPAGPAADPAPCPSCGVAMEDRRVDAGRVAVCKACEMVWADKDALAELPAATVPRPDPVSAARVPRCSHCGAPLSASWDERCRYCGSTIAPVTTVVVAPGPRRHRYVDDLGLPGRILGWIIDGVVSAISLWS